MLVVTKVSYMMDSPRNTIILSLSYELRQRFSTLTYYFEEKEEEEVEDTGRPPAYKFRITKMMIVEKFLTAPLSSSSIIIITPPTPLIIRFRTSTSLPYIMPVLSY